MNNLKPLGTIGSVTVQLDTTDAKQPALILNANALAEHLATLISPEQPLVVDWLDEWKDRVILRLNYTPAVDRRIADIINTLMAVYDAVPNQVRNEVTAWTSSVRSAPIRYSRSRMPASSQGISISALTALGLPRRTSWQC